MHSKLNPSVEKAYRYLLNVIMSFELAPSEQISDSQIAKALDISRAPVREAILLLITDGMIQSVDGKMIVAPMNLDDIVDILRVRTALETECLTIISSNGWLSKRKETALKNIHDRFAASADSGSLSDQYAFDDAFHMELVDAAGSPRIKAITDQMRLQMQRARWLNLAVPSRQISSIQEHALLLDAILSHDLPLAIQRMREHMSNSEQSFRNILSNEQTQHLAKAISSFFD